MRNTIFYLILIVMLIIVVGCGRHFQLERFPKVPESAWRFERKDSNSTGQIKGGFQGGLKLHWKGKFGESPIGPLTIGADRIIIPTSRDRAHFFDKSSGKYEGRVKIKGNAQTGLIIVDSLAYFSAGPIKNEFRCLNLHTLKDSWETPVKDVTGSPIIIKDRVFLASTTGVAECRDRLTGDLVWRKKMSSRSPAGPSYAGNTIYYPLDDGSLTALDINTGEIVFEMHLEEPLMSKVAIGEYVFVAGSEGTFFAVSKESGEIVWRRQFEWPIWTAPAIDENMVYFGDNGGYIYALDKKDGRTIWNFKSEGVIIASPIVVGDFLLFASLDRHLYCLDKKSGLLNSKIKTKHEVRFSPISDGESIYVATSGGIVECLGD